MKPKFFIVKYKQDTCKMDTLSDILYPYRDLIASTAGIVTVGQMFSGSFMCYGMYKQRGTGGVGVMPFLGGLVMGLLNLKFGYMLRDDTMIVVNFVGIALSILYLMVYYHYAQDKTGVWVKMGLAGAFSAAVIAYTEMEDPELVEYRFGLILTAFMFWLIASPLLDLGDIIKKQSTEKLPFPLILSGTVVTFMWLLHGIVLKNKFIVIQNAVAFMLCFFQLSLFVIYPPKPEIESKKSTKKTD